MGNDADSVGHAGSYPAGHGRPSAAVCRNLTKTERHLNKLLVPERRPLARGVRYAETAGTYVGSHQHTHFVFHVFEEGESHFLDPWMLFWQMFRDRQPLQQIPKP